MKASRELDDVFAGRVWVDWAYAMGCLAELGDDEALPLFDKVLELQNARRAMRHALISQFRMGRRHERARDAP